MYVCVCSERTLHPLHSLSVTALPSRHKAEACVKKGVCVCVRAHSHAHIYAHKMKVRRIGCLVVEKNRRTRALSPPSVPPPGPVPDRSRARARTRPPQAPQDRRGSSRTHLSAVSRPDHPSHSARPHTASQPRHVLMRQR